MIVSELNALFLNDSSSNFKFVVSSLNIRNGILAEVLQDVAHIVRFLQPCDV